MTQLVPVVPTAAAPSLVLDHLATAETLVVQLTAILKISEPGSAISLLARHCLSLVDGLHNDFQAEVESIH